MRGRGQAVPHCEQRRPSANTHSPCPPTQVCSWVSETLRKEGIDGEAAIVTAFRTQCIRGQHLSMLTPELLHNELEFGALGHRLSFLQVSNQSACITGRPCWRDNPRLTNVLRQARDRLLGTGPDGTDKGQDGVVKLMETIGSNVASLNQKLVTLSARVEEMVCALLFPCTPSPPRIFPSPVAAIASDMAKILS